MVSMEAKKQSLVTPRNSCAQINLSAAPGMFFMLVVHLQQQPTSNTAFKKQK